MNRRQVLYGLSGACVVGAAGAAWVWLRPRGDHAGHGHAGHPHPIASDIPTDENGVPLAPDGRPVFPERFRRTLRALAGRLVPDEPDKPGATALDAFNYIEREMTFPNMQGARRRLMRGAAVLDKMSASRHGALFDGATPEQQDALITAMVEGEGKSRKLDPAEFIRLMLALTLEGMFSDPIHGGNKEMQGWLYIGYAMHPPRPCSPEEIAEGLCEEFKPPQ